MAGDGFGGPAAAEEDREAEAGVGGGSRAGPEAPLHKRPLTAALAGSCLPCEVALEAVGRAGLSEAASCPVGICSAAGLAQQREELREREGGEGKRDSGEKEQKLGKRKRHVKNPLLLRPLTSEPSWAS